VAAVIVVQTRATPKFSALLRGGTDTHAAELAAARLQSELTQRGSAISSFVRSPRRIPGRILAEIDDGHRAVFAILPPERGKREQNRLTWISIHRSPERAPFIERERRLLELFHSQSAFALLRCADA
jgi:hypothetical protein